MQDNCPLVMEHQPPFFTRNSIMSNLAIRKIVQFRNRYQTLNRKPLAKTCSESSNDLNIVVAFKAAFD